MTKYLGFQYSVMLTQSTVSVNNKHIWYFPRTIVLCFN